MLSHRSVDPILAPSPPYVGLCGPYGSVCEPILDLSPPYVGLRLPYDSPCWCYVGLSWPYVAQIGAWPPCITTAPPARHVRGHYLSLLSQHLADVSSFIVFDLQHISNLLPIIGSCNSAPPRRTRRTECANGSLLAWFGPPRTSSPSPTNLAHVNVHFDATISLHRKIDCIMATLFG